MVVKFWEGMYEMKLPSQQNCVYMSENVVTNCFNIYHIDIKRCIGHNIHLTVCKLKYLKVYPTVPGFEKYWGD